MSQATFKGTQEMEFIREGAGDYTVMQADRTIGYIRKSGANAIVGMTWFFEPTGVPFKYRRYARVHRDTMAECQIVAEEYISGGYADTIEVAI